jgi:K+-transporting ATPase ATPase C chain
VPRALHAAFARHLAALRMLVVLSVNTGVLYPLAVTGVAQVVFPGKANGEQRLIGQDFGGKPQYFQSRPSATGYSASATAFNNLGPNQASLAAQIKAAAATYMKQNPGTRLSEIPPDAVTTSASGIDPDISMTNALIRARRVARVRGVPRASVDKLIDDHTDGRFLFLGEPGVNVLELNRALDKELP